MADFHIMAGTGRTLAHPTIRRIGVSDVLSALREGLEDFFDRPSHYIFLCLIYPVAGLVLGTWASGANALPLIFPLVSGFALLGPVAAIGLYEISRRRERGMDVSWQHAFDVRHSSALPSIALIAVMLLVLFVVWLLIAEMIYVRTLGPTPPVSAGAFLGTVFTTAAGWQMILIGNAAGFVLALIVLSTTVLAFPLLLDRDVGALVAVQTSARAVAANPLPMAAWGVIVAALMVLGSIPLLAGLAVVLPILGHATWHLYRKVIA
ncbi:MAG TPA: DUF2189 domain-containing protein [Pararhizobium sp.]|nr:DUF2189 domain-containing protein [Pararhizobium sp.]